MGFKPIQSNQIQPNPIHMDAWILSMNNPELVYRVRQKVSLLIFCEGARNWVWGGINVGLYFIGLRLINFLNTAATLNINFRQTKSIFVRTL